MGRIVDRLGPIIDLEGESGAYYRFRQIPEAPMLPAAGGNFVCVQHNETTVDLICSGTASDLRLASDLCEAALLKHPVAVIFVRLNISRDIRSREHEDLVKRHHPSIVADDMRLTVG